MKSNVLRLLDEFFNLTFDPESGNYMLVYKGCVVWGETIEGVVYDVLDKTD